MAWDNRLTQKCGAPPDWAEPLSVNAEPSRKFLESRYCMFPINGGARENWPRSGLEAMASGVPVVAQNDWGWQEMIEHGVTGFLGNDDCELAHYAAGPRLCLLITEIPEAEVIRGGFLVSCA